MVPPPVPFAAECLPTPVKRTKISQVPLAFPNRKLRASGKRLAHSASLCDAPSSIFTSKRLSSRPARRRLFSSSRTSSTTCLSLSSRPASRVPIARNTFSGHCRKERLYFRILQLEINSDGLSSNKRPNTPGRSIAVYKEISAPKDDPPSPVFSGPRAMRYRSYTKGMTSFIKKSG